MSTSKVASGWYPSYGYGNFENVLEVPLISHPPEISLQHIFSLINTTSKADIMVSYEEMLLRPWLIIAPLALSCFSFAGEFLPVPAAALLASRANADDISSNSTRDAAQREREMRKTPTPPQQSTISRMGGRERHVEPLTREREKCHHSCNNQLFWELEREKERDATAATTINYFENQERERCLHSTMVFWELEWKEGEREWGIERGGEWCHCCHPPPQSTVSIISWDEYHL